MVPARRVVLSPTVYHKMPLKWEESPFGSKTLHAHSKARAKSSTMRRSLSIRRTRGWFAQAVGAIAHRPSPTAWPRRLHRGPAAEKEGVRSSTVCEPGLLASKGPASSYSPRHLPSSLAADELESPGRVMDPLGDGSGREVCDPLWRRLVSDWSATGRRLDGDYALPDSTHAIPSPRPSGQH